MFQNDEWTAVRDIGKKYNDKEVSKEAYLGIERKRYKQTYSEGTRERIHVK